MDNAIGLVVVILSLGFPLGVMYTYYCVLKLRSQERLAAMARGVEFLWSRNFLKERVHVVGAYCWFKVLWVTRQRLVLSLTSQNLMLGPPRPWASFRSLSVSGFSSTGR